MLQIPCYSCHATHEMLHMINYNRKWFFFMTYNRVIKILPYIQNFKTLYKKKERHLFSSVYNFIYLLL